MEAIIGAALLGVVAFALYGKRGSKAREPYVLEGPMRPYVKVNGIYKEVVHRRRSGNVLVCTLRPDSRGARRAKVAVPLNGVEWLPKGSYKELS